MASLEGGNGFEVAPTLVCVDAFRVMAVGFDRRRRDVFQIEIQFGICSSWNLEVPHDAARELIDHGEDTVFADTLDFFSTQDLAARGFL